MAVQKQLKIARNENTEQQTEMLLLIKRLEDMHTEQTILKELRGDDAESTDDEMLEAEIATDLANKAASKNDEDPDEDEQETLEEIKARRKRERAKKRENEETKELEERIAEDP